MFIWACLTRSPMNHPLTPEGPLPTPPCICPTLLKVGGGVVGSGQGSSTLGSPYLYMAGAGLCWSSAV